MKLAIIGFRIAAAVSLFLLAVTWTHFNFYRNDATFCRAILYLLAAEYLKLRQRLGGDTIKSAPPSGY